jgi:hypothetical protein
MDVACLRQKRRGLCAGSLYRTVIGFMASGGIGGNRGEVVLVLCGVRQLPHEKGYQAWQQNISAPWRW